MKIFLFLSKNYPYSIFDITTNGQNPALIKESMAKIFSAIDPSRLNFLVSLDGLRKTHDKVRGRAGAFEAAEETLNQVRKLSPSVRLIISFTLVPWNYRELLEVTHTHIFSIPIVVFILSRILAMTHTREGLKITIYGVSFMGIILNLAAPWLIRYACHHFVITFTISNILLILSFGAYIFIPLYEMWFRRDHDGLAD